MNCYQFTPSYMFTSHVTSLKGYKLYMYIAVQISWFLNYSTVELNIKLQSKFRCKQCMYEKLPLFLDWLAEPVSEFTGMYCSSSDHYTIHMCMYTIQVLSWPPSHLSLVTFWPVFYGYFGELNLNTITKWMLAIMPLFLCEYWTFPHHRHFR